ncbi:MAG: SusD/RagB family nutrient-binding outer membrane lipoprotein [Rikenellaceae bacterium]|nr:SusD/RagB family nutrient-binding outer membrane lipoprotein [Rikenellaceae bacterium]
MKNIRYFKFLVPAAALLAAGCTGDFDWRNTNPDNATEEMMDYDDIRAGAPFKQIVRNVVPSFQLTGDEEYGSANYQVIQDLAGNIFAGYTGSINTGFLANNLYNITYSAWHEAMFTDAYSRAMSEWYLLDNAREASPEKAAMGDIAKIALMHRVTDTYGPVPYSRAGESVITSPYDSQESIYRSFFEELEDAVEVLTTFYRTQPDLKLMADYDDVFYGDVEKWIKFANTLRLRLALRVVYADAALAEENARLSVEHEIGVMTSNSDLAKLNVPTTGPWENPLYVIQYSFDDARIGATIEAYMNGYDDPRRPVYFTANTNGEYRGVRNGITVNNNYASSTLLSRVNCTNTSGLYDGALLWMPTAEAYFLLAEAAIRWNWLPQSAQYYYEEGIRASFDSHGVSGADAYIVSTNTPAAYTDVVSSSNSMSAPSTVTVAWSDSDSFETRLERIITQKYIALFPEGQEAWSEFRRTGYPKVFQVSVNNSSGAISISEQIRRLNYPVKEYTSSNAEEVQKAVSILASESSSGSLDNGGTHVWWDKK